MEAEMTMIFITSLESAYAIYFIKYRVQKILRLTIAFIKFVTDER